MRKHKKYGSGTLLCMLTAVAMTVSPMNVYAADVTQSGAVNEQISQQDTLGNIQVEGKINGVFGNSEEVIIDETPYAVAECWYLTITNNTKYKVLFYDVNGSTTVTKKACADGTIAIHGAVGDTVRIYACDGRQKEDESITPVTLTLCQAGYEIGDEGVVPFMNAAVTDTASVTADQTIFYQEANYKLKDGEAAEKTISSADPAGTTFAYEKDADGAEVTRTEGTVFCVGNDGTFLEQITEDFDEEGNAVITLQDSYTAEDVTYTIPEDQSKSVTLTKENPKMTITYLNDDLAEVGGTRLVSITYVDENGASIIKDTIAVKNGIGYTYYAPTVFSKSAGNQVLEYTTDAENAKVVIAKTAAEDKEYKVSYTSNFDASKTKTWNIMMIDAYTGTTIGSESFSIANGDSQSYTAADTITYNGTTYTIDGSMETSYTRSFDDANSTTYIYYNPEGYTAETGYPISVQYMNIADNSVIYSEEMTVLPGADTVIDCPAEYSAAGANYIRLNGQTDTIRHSYYSPKRTYTIYYRNENDTINSDAEVTTIDVINTVTEVVVQETTTTTGGTTTTGTTTTGNATGNNDTAGTATGTGTTTTEASDEATPTTVTSIDNETTGDTSLRSDDGTEVSNMGQVVEDEETPLADTQLEDSTSHTAMWIIIGAGVLAVLGVIFFMMKRKKNSTGEEQE